MINFRNCWITNRNRKDFSLATIFINLIRCCLQLENFKKLIFISKNWLTDAKVGCKSLSDLVEFIEMDEQLKEELQEFE